MHLDACCAVTLVATRISPPLLHSVLAASTKSESTTDGWVVTMVKRRVQLLKGQRSEVREQVRAQEKRCCAVDIRRTVLGMRVCGRRSSRVVERPSLISLTDPVLLQVRLRIAYEDMDDSLRWGNRWPAYAPFLPLLFFPFFFPSFFPLCLSPPSLPSSKARLIPLGPLSAHFTFFFSFFLSFLFHFCFIPSYLLAILHRRRLSCCRAFLGAPLCFVDAGPPQHLGLPLCPRSPTAHVISRVSAFALSASCVPAQWQGTWRKIPNTKLKAGPPRWRSMSNPIAWTMGSIPSRIAFSAWCVPAHSLGDFLELWNVERVLVRERSIELAFCI